MLSRLCALFVLVACAMGATGCATTRPGSADAGGPRAGRVLVVAAENFWGSIAAQIGGDRVQVVSIINRPDTDPHDYEPTAADARTVESADVVIGNGIGYDPWFGQLVASAPDHPQSVDVGRVAGLGLGDNPHQWYSANTVEAVMTAITQAFTAAAPSLGAEFAAGRAAYDGTGLAQYKATIAAIRARYAGVKIGASESIVTPLAQTLGLDLITPAEFLGAVSEGTDPTAGAKTVTDRQIAHHQIAVWIYNAQNATPDVARLNDAARAAGIPIVTVTETMAPAGTTFQAWQTTQLRRLQAALAEAAR